MRSIQASRVNETNPSPYDQVFFLTQAVINEAFYAMFPSPVPFKRQDKEAARTGRTGQWITKGQVLAPEVVIHVEDRSPAYFVLFTLHFHSGTIHLRTSPPGATDTFQPFRLDGWRLVFKTRITSKVLDSNDPKFAVYRSARGFRDTVFELAQLYLDASDVGAGAGFDASKSSFNGTALSPDTLYNLKRFVSEWLTAADEHHLNVIGYSLTRQKPTSRSPERDWVSTFTPTIIDYAPYAWIDPRHPTVERDGLPQNALAILTYADNSRRSTHAPPGLQHSGAFVDEGAAFCMNRDLFWSRYLLPILQVINQKTELIPKRPARNHIEARFIIGKNPKHGKKSDKYFSWKPHSRNGQPVWSWKGELHKVDVTWAETATQYKQSAQSSTEVIFSPGGRNIDVKLRVVYNSDVVHRGKHSAARIEINWVVPFRIQAVSNGGIQVIRAGNFITDPKPLKASTKHDKSMEKLYKHLTRDLRRKMNPAIRATRNQLVRELRDFHKLFLPGGGIFRFGEPLFNKRGDVLADLVYMNMKPPANRFVVNRTAVTDASNETEADTILPDAEDLVAQFARIALLSGEEYPEDEEPEFDDDGEDTQIDDEEPEEVAVLLCRFEDIGSLSRGYDSDDENDFPDPSDRPPANVVDWFDSERTERTWPEEGDEEYPDEGQEMKPKNGWFPNDNDMDNDLGPPSPGPLDG